jgi:glutathione S-transferase
VPYEDVLIPFEAFAKLKAQGRFPFSQLPMLQVILTESPTEVRKVSIAQSGSIARYLAPLTGLQPDGGPLEAAVCDSYFEAAQELARIVNRGVVDEQEKVGRVCVCVCVCVFCMWWSC